MCPIMCIRSSHFNLLPRGIECWRVVDTVRNNTHKYLSDDWKEEVFRREWARSVEVEVAVVRVLSARNALSQSEAVQGLVDGVS